MPLFLPFIACAVLWGMAVLILTETLSLFHIFSFYPLLSVWLLVLGPALYWAYRRRHSLKAWFSRPAFSRWALTEKFLFVALAVIALLKGYSALMSAPNTSDAMTYHLSRVEHWVQNASVAHYPSHILRQLYSPSWAEYAIAHLRILTHGDHFSNAVQWFACIGSWMGVMALARMLGADRRGQLLAAVLAAVLPMGLVQATSTQTDYVLTFWMTGFVYLLWELYQQPRWPMALLTGACLGLAMLTKGNAYIFAPVWLLVYAGAALRARDGGRLRLLAAVITVAALLNIPYALRNTATFGSPVWTHVRLTNETVSVSAVMDNMARNAALHLKAPWSSSTGEDDAVNVLYAFLFMAVLSAMALRPDLRRNGSFWTYAAALAGMWIFFCAVVAYQPWNSRFHLTVFVLSCPLAAAVMVHVLRRWSLIPAALMLVCAWPWLLSSNEHPFLGPKSILSTTRLQQYFSEQPILALPYTMALQLLRSQDCHEIGLIEPENGWEYPWWVLLRQAYGDKFRLEHVAVDNVSKALDYPRGPFAPCALIALQDRGTLVTLPSGLYVRAWFMDLPQGLTSVFIRISKGPVPARGTYQ